ncbi:hypothetical protein Trydic_g1688 [Trypoxylus dichotomus]
MVSCGVIGTAFAESSSPLLPFEEKCYCRLLADIYGDHVSSEPTCRYCFQRFKNGDFDANDKERDGIPKKFQNEELEELLDIDPCQTLEELPAALDVDQSIVGKRKHVLRMVQKVWNWVPHELKERHIERRLVTCEMLLQRQERKIFLHRIITGDEK